MMRKLTGEHIYFSKPVELLEVFRCSILLDKDERTGSRAAPFLWDPFPSSSGAVTGDGLFLNVTSTSINTAAVQILVLLSDHPQSNSYHRPEAGCIPMAQPRKLKIDSLLFDPQSDWTLWRTVSNNTTAAR
jgi:hypothetical protein